MITREVYIAAPWAAKAEALEFRDVMEQVKPWVSTSRWIDVLHTWDSPDEVQRADMFDDLADIHRADTFLILNNYPPSPGRLTELGYALALRKRIIVIQPGTWRDAKNIFLLHPLVEIYPSLMEVPNETV